METDMMNNISEDDVLEEVVAFALSIKKIDNRFYSTNYGKKTAQGLKQSFRAILSLREPEGEK